MHSRHHLPGRGVIDSLHLREYEPGDEVAIVRGLERAFAPVDAGFRAPSLAQWRWRWLANPAGARVTLAVDDAGEVRAQYAAQGREVLVGGARVPASHAADSFVDPGLRALGRRGLFVRTGERFAATFGGDADGRDRWMYGWPAPAAARIGARALGYRGVRADALLVRAADAPAPEVAPAVRAHAVGAEYDALCAERAGAYAALGVRDAAWLRWRFLDAPAASTRCSRRASTARSRATRSGARAAALRSRALGARRLARAAARRARRWWPAPWRRRRGARSRCSCRRGATTSPRCRSSASASSPRRCGWWGAATTGACRTRPGARGGTTPWPTETSRERLRAARARRGGPALAGALSRARVRRGRARRRCAALVEPRRARRRARFVALHDGEVAAAYLGRATSTWFAGERRAFVQSVDSMVDPAHRAGLKRPGLFVELARAYFAHYGAAGGDAVHYGWPVEEAWRLGERFLDYALLREELVLVRELGGDDDAGDAAPVVGALDVDALEPDLAWLWDRCAPRWGAATLRDAAWARWRFAEHPTTRYRLRGARDAAGVLRGFAALRASAWSWPGAHALVDWLVPDEEPDVFDALERDARALARAAGAARLVTLVPPWSGAFARFQALGWRVRLAPYRCAARSFDRRCDLAWLRAHWWTTLADSDLA
ncbi:MAG: hypothetical protein H6828_12220 [Planctomycetes bacterium]|nr:hypothetical protein [Planctomycetota bacterium]